MKNTVWLLNSHGASDSVVRHAESLLAPDSCARQNALGRPSLRERFALSRALLRTAMAELCGCPSAHVVVVERPNDVPSLSVDGLVSISASLSHSQSWIACALSTGAAVGLDIECMDRPRDLDAVSAWAFHTDERAWMHAQADRREAFYRLWTGKEAVVKLGTRLGAAGSIFGTAFGVRAGALDPPSPATALAFWRIEPEVACSLAHDRSVPPATVRRVAPQQLLALRARVPSTATTECCVGCQSGRIATAAPL